MRPSHSSHDWHVQPYCQRPKHDPPEGRTFSPERSHTSANPSVLETFQTYRAELLRVNPLCSQDFHLIFTLGSCYRLSRGRLGPCDSGTLKDSNARLPLELWAEIHSAPAHGTRQRKSSNLRKDHLEVVATNAKPFEELCPRIKTPWPGLISELVSLLNNLDAIETKRIRNSNPQLNVIENFLCCTTFDAGPTREFQKCPASHAMLST